ncbi:hypothetical protein BDU57DRAFT_543495 [Ampelomyces quisqualis]|uniref:Uncharacterized protein n=1 Tax=Ampelomyces quisqualis TaxID=50730 RepID=A0A6A5Q8R0_AMPQU|nr:hypothetical protein BDU57DRAFT_543495 [Ampelomyces quisqualis]
MELKEQHLLQNGTITPREFNFDSTTFERNLKANIRFHTYDKADPATWPLITLDIIDSHCRTGYTGEQILPPYVAYSASVIERLFEKHTKKDLTRDTTTGTLQSRYPCNFGQRDLRKTYVGITANEDALFKQGMAEKLRAEAKPHSSKNAAELPNEARPGFASPMPDRSVRCQKMECVQDRKEKAELMGLLNKQQAKRQILQAEIRELVKRNNEIKAHRGKFQQDDDGQQEAIELRDRLIEKLQEENSRLEGGYKPGTVEDYFSEEEERPVKRARVD